MTSYLIYQFRWAWSNPAYCFTSCCYLCMSRILYDVRQEAHRFSMLRYFRKSSFAIHLKIKISFFHMFVKRYIY